MFIISATRMNYNLLQLYGCNVIIVYTTVEKSEQAENIAQILLTERLVACANMWPIHSMYTFNGKLVKSAEIGVYLKTGIDRQDAVYNRLVELHPYECPAIITMKIDQAHLPFVHWAHEQTGS